MINYMLTMFLLDSASYIKATKVLPYIEPRQQIDIKKAYYSNILMPSLAYREWWESE